MKYRPIPVLLRIVLWGMTTLIYLSLEWILELLKELIGWLDRVLPDAIKND